MLHLRGERRGSGARPNLASASFLSQVYLSMPTEFVRSSFLVYLSEMDDYEMIAANASWYYAFSPGDIYRRDRAKAAMQVLVLPHVILLFCINDLHLCCLCSYGPLVLLPAQ
jgi:hypothetical protein